MATKSWADWFSGRKKPEKPQVPESELAGGHRGVAQGSRAEPDLSAANVEKWEQTTQDEVSNFVNRGEIMYVHSSNLEWIQYKIENQQLYIKFKQKGRGRGHTLYEYDGVTPQEAIMFAKESSKGGKVWDLLRVRGSATGARKFYRPLA